MKRRSPWKVSLTWLSTNSTTISTKAWGLDGTPAVALRAWVKEEAAEQADSERDHPRVEVEVVAQHLHFAVRQVVDDVFGQATAALFRTHARSSIPSATHAQNFVATNIATAATPRRPSTATAAGATPRSRGRTADDHDHPLRRQPEQQAPERHARPCTPPAKRSMRPRRPPSVIAPPPTSAPSAASRPDSRQARAVAASRAAWMAAVRCASRRPAATVFSTRVIRGGGKAADR